MNSKVQVGICLRPLVKHEVEAGAESVVRIVDRKQVVVSHESSSVRCVSQSVLICSADCPSTHDCSERCLIAACMAYSLE